MPTTNPPWLVDDMKFMRHLLRCTTHRYIVPIVGLHVEDFSGDRLAAWRITDKYQSGRSVHRTCTQVWPCKVGDEWAVKEPWVSWKDTCDTASFMPDPEDHVCSKHCKQVYVGYQATPREGYRPVPDMERITYLDRSTPLKRGPAKVVEGKWRTPKSMPDAFVRLHLRVSSVVVRKVTGGHVWAITCQPILYGRTP